MKVQTSCPACDKPITVWRVMAAPTPWHLKCGSCHARLRAIGLTAPALVVAVLVGLPLAWFVYTKMQVHEGRAALLVAVAAVALVELLLSVVLVNSAKLEPK